MKLKNILFVVHNIEKAKTFYKTLFKLEVIRDFGDNIIMTEGLVLQEKKTWEDSIRKEVQTEANDAALYFEENHFDEFMVCLENSEFAIEYVHPPMELDWGKRVVRIYDFDKHIIEIGESSDYVARRLLKSGMTVEEVAKKTHLPASHIEEL